MQTSQGTFVCLPCGVDVGAGVVVSSPVISKENIKESYYLNNNWPVIPNTIRTGRHYTKTSNDSKLMASLQWLNRIRV